MFCSLFAFLCEKMDDILKKLHELSEPEYAAFSSKLIPGIEARRVLGVRAPALRTLAAELTAAQRETFMACLPHDYHEENMLHAYLIGRMREPENIYKALSAFLPHVDNWAVCDSLRPAALKKEPRRLLEAVESWLASEHGYTIRFGIEMLMCYYLDELFDEAYPAKVAAVKSDDYYVNMMISWYFATALAKQWDAVIPYIEQRRLSPRVHNKSIQKAVESYRINAEQKAYLRALR